MAVLSRFQRPRQRVGSSKRVKDELYDMAGLNLVSPDPLITNNESPFAINFRGFARQSHESRVAIRTRPGSSFFTDPILEAADVENDASPTGQIDLTYGMIVSDKIQPEDDGLFTKLELSVKRMTMAIGSVLVEIRRDVNDLPADVLAVTSIPSSSITDSFSTIAVRFIDPIQVNDESYYWITLRMAKEDSGTLAIQTSAGSSVYASLNNGDNWNPVAASFIYKTYRSDTLTVIGTHSWYKTNGTWRGVIATPGKIYEVLPNNTFNEIGTCDASATKVRFADADDKLYWVDGVDKPQSYDGDTQSEVTNGPVAANLIILHENRMFYGSARTRTDYSDLFPDFGVFQSVNFFYTPNPMSPDHQTGYRVHKDNLWVFTQKSKHIIVGTNISNFQRRQWAGSKGAVSQEAITSDRNNIYFLSDDYVIYAFNGTGDDIPISQRVETELSSITNFGRVRLEVFNNQLRVYYAKGSSPVMDNILIYDIEQDKWFHDTGKPVLACMQRYLETGELIEVSSKTGQLIKAEDGTSDLGRPIDFKYWTPYKPYSSGMGKDKISRFRVFLLPSDSEFTLLVGKDVDWRNDGNMKKLKITGGVAVWGGFVWGDGTVWGRDLRVISPKVSMPGKGNFTQFRFECNELDAVVQILGYGAVVKEGKPK